jgi:hypothetical protein
MTEHMIDGEKAYPIFRVSFNWAEDGECYKCKGEDKNCPVCKDLGEGRMSNGTSMDNMYEGEKTVEEVTKEMKVWWEEYKERNKGKMKNPTDIDIKVEFMEYETWVQEWFAHRTFDKGQTDDEILTSFEKFVTRKEHVNETESEWVEFETSTKEGATGYMQDKYCLMGAEDRWRWKADKDGTNPPCRCKHCKEQGIVRIGH